MDHEFTKRLRTASSASSSVDSLSYGGRPPSTASSSWTSENSGASPKRNAQRVYGDRFIPSRSETDLATAYALRQVAEPLPASARSLGKRKASEKASEPESLKCELVFVPCARLKKTKRLTLLAHWKPLLQLKMPIGPSTRCSRRNFSAEMLNNQQISCKSMPKT